MLRDLPILRYDSALDDFIQLRQRTFYPKTDLELPLAELNAIREERDREAPALAGALLQSLRFEGRRPTSIQPLSSGTFHLLFRADFGPNTIAYVRTGYTFRQRPAFEFVIELSISELLPSTKVPGAEVLCNDLTRVEFPLDYQLIREAPGHPLNKIENPDTQFIPDAILEDWGRTLARVHQINATGAGLLNPRALEHGRCEGVLSSWNDYLLLNLDKHLDLCVAAGAVPSKVLPSISKTIFDSIPRLGNVPIRLLQGDPGHHNIFAAGEKISAIIDWEDALAGDPIFDVAYWGTFVRDYMREPFLRGYREISPLSPDFEFRYWLYYLRVAISKTAHRHLFAYKDRPGRPPPSERISKALSYLTTL